MRDRSASYRYMSANGMPASNLLEFLAHGGGDETQMRELAGNLLAYVNERRDCADFRAAYLIRILYSYEDLLPRDLAEEIKSALLAFPYEDCGGHSMCTWTENHRLYAAGTEYLLARKLEKDRKTKCPAETARDGCTGLDAGNCDDASCGDGRKTDNAICEDRGETNDTIFGDGRDSAYHRKHAADELLRELDAMLKYGFAEWGSNNYYSETMAGLANIVQFIEEEAIRTKAEKVLLMMVYDILSQTSCNGGYIYNPACARAYADNKVSSEIGNYLEPQIRAMRGEKVNKFKEKEGCMILLLEARKENGEPIFEIPQEWLSLPDTDGRETALMQGVDIDEYGQEGLAAYSRENVRFAFMAGAISDHRVICHSMRYLCESGLIDNGMLKKLKPFAKPILYRTGILKALKRMVPNSFDGAAMEKGRVYTYACRNYSISAAFDYRVGQVLFQQNSLALNLSHRISIFANNPYSGPGKIGSPGYWIGSGIAPRAAAYRNFAACMFDLRHASKGQQYTHLFLPVSLFDQTDLSRIGEGIVFARTGPVNLCVRTNPGVAFRPAEESLRDDVAMYQDEKVAKGYYISEYDLINRAEGLHYYVFEVDDTMSFEEFMNIQQGRKLDFQPKIGTLSYSCYDCSLKYDGEFTVGGEEFVPDFRRPLNLIGNLG